MGVARVVDGRGLDAAPHQAAAVLRQAPTQRDAAAGLWALRWAAISLRDLVVLSTDSTLLGSPNQVPLQTASPPVRQAARGRK